MTTASINHSFLAKILVRCKEEKGYLHNDPSRGYKHFATDIQDLIQFGYVDANGDDAFEKIEVNYVCADLENPKSHFVSINVKTLSFETTKEVYSTIFWILEEDLSTLEYQLEHLKEVKREKRMIMDNM
tara:strand:- start:215 stop:601 length:387 start_codon:yes stop_codon:yes gene_type:complete